MGARTKSLFVGALILWAAGAGQAKQVSLDVSMANPTLLAGQKQTTFVKVGLTGFETKVRERAPVNVVIVLDKSGSMSGEKIAKAREAAIAAVRRLSVHDIVSVVTYDSTVRVVVPATRLTDKDSVCAAISQITADGSTALFAGVSKGAAEIRKFLARDRVNRILLLSDGLANVGPQSPGELGELGASLSKEAITVSTLGLGLDYNEDLMSQLARRSGGNHFFIEKAEDLVRIFGHEFDDILSVVAQEAVIEIETAPEVRPVRVLNMDAEINGRRVIATIDQIYSKQEKYVLLEVEIPPTAGATTREIAKVTVSYANLDTKTNDRLSSTVSVRFTDLPAVVEKDLNTKVMEACVLQIANLRNELATTIRDKGDIEEARRVLLDNSGYLSKYGDRLGSEVLRYRALENERQSENLEGEKYIQNRKLMRDQQFMDRSQRAPLPSSSPSR